MALLEPFAEQRVGDEAGEEAGTENDENEVGHGGLQWSLWNSPSLH
jgi:hypothetical protein